MVGIGVFIITRPGRIAMVLREYNVALTDAAIFYVTFHKCCK